MLPGIRAELESLRRRHSAALELMGERDEEVWIAFFFGSFCFTFNKFWELKFACFGMRFIMVYVEVFCF